MARMSKEDKLKKEVSEYKRKHGIPEKNEEEDKEEKIVEVEKEPSFWHQMIPFFLVIGALLIVA